jgi:hypothetical protein
VDAVTRATPRDGPEYKGEAKKVCVPGLTGVRDEAEGFAYCVPDGWSERKRGSERVYSKGKGLELVLSAQVKVTDAADVLAVLVPFLEKAGNSVEMLPDASLRYTGRTTNGMAFGKHLLRFGALLYSSCTGTKQECAPHEDTARQFAQSFEFLGEVMAPSRENRQSTGHEMTHVLTFRAWGTPSQALLGEGIAVALDQSGRDVHLAAVEALGDRLAEFRLSSLLADAWFEQPPEVAYAVSGSFAKFLLDLKGPGKLAEIYKASDFTASLQSIYGLTLDQAQAAWLEGMTE